MPFTLLRGIFKPDAGFPDGDTIRFVPENPDLLFSLPRQGRLPRVNANNGTVSLRYEGIDAVEKDAIEPFALDATNQNLDRLGLTSPTDEAPGYILTNQIGPNGRPISFVFAGTPDEEDGDQIFLEAGRMQDSVNYQLVESGAVYPFFFDTLFADLRGVLATATNAARSSELGLWPSDRTTIGVEWEGASSLPTLDPILPRLWRRLERYTQDRDFRDESETLDGFIDFLMANSDRLFIVSESRFTDLDNIVEIDGSQIRLTTVPEDLIFTS